MKITVVGVALVIAAVIVGIVLIRYMQNTGNPGPNQGQYPKG